MFDMIVFAHKTRIFAAFSLLCAVTLPYQVYAQQQKKSATPSALAKAEAEENAKMNWEQFSSESKVFSVRFPEKYQFKLYPIALNDTMTAYSEEIIASDKSFVEKLEAKTYLVKADQTLGSPLSLAQIHALLAKEVRTYQEFAKANNGIVLKNDDITHHGFVGKDIYLNYTDKEFHEKEKLALRIRILYSDSARVQLVLSGTTSGMYSYTADSFFNSIRLSDGYAQDTNRKELGWKKFSDANNIFTMVIPPKHPSYRLLSPRYKLSNRISSAHVIFKDPVVDQNIYYNVYAYKMGINLNDKIAAKVLFSQHLSKFVTGAMSDSLKLNYDTKDGYRIASTQLLIEPKEDLPYVDGILLKAFYKDQTIVVQEVVGSQGHALGDFAKFLTNQLEFHPEKFKETTTQEILKNNKEYLAAKEQKTATPDKHPKAAN